jgi:type IV pilus assembly protein PilB
MLANPENESPMEQSNGTRWERPDAPLGTLVYRAGLLSKDKLEAALEEGQRSGRRLGEILLQKGWIDEKDLARLLAGQRGLQFVSLKGRGYERETAKLLPERVCRYHNAIAVESSGERVLVAIADPTDDGALQEIKDELGRPIELVVATTSEIRGALDELFGAGAPAPAPAEGTPAVSAITPIGDLGLRIAVPPPVEEAEPEPVAETSVEPVAEAPVEPEAEAAPEPVVAAVPEPEPEPAPAEPVVTPLPDPVVHADPEPAADPEPEPEAPAAPEIPAPAAPVPSLESITSSLPDAVPSPPEPTIERNEAAHVSVAFNAPPVAEPEPAAEPPAPAEPETVAAPEPVPVAEAAEQRPVPTDAPYCLVLNLVDGEQVDVAYFAESDEATAAARALVAGITRDAEWPQVGRTFYPPERIASVEIRERQRFAGNPARAGWGGGEPPTPAA